MVSALILAVVFAAGVCCATAADVNPALDALCQDWVMKTQKHVLLSQVLGDQNQIGSCGSYCVIIGGGFRTDTTTCRLLCEAAGGVEGLKSAMQTQGGSASANEVCNAIFTAESDEQEKIPAAIPSFPHIAQQKQQQQQPTMPRQQHQQRRAPPAHADVVHHHPQQSSEDQSFLELAAQQQQQRELAVRGDMTVQGSLNTHQLASPVGDVKISGEVKVTGQIETTSSRSAFFKVEGGSAVVKDRIVSKRDQLLVKGRIDADMVSAESLQASFLEIGGVRQWSLVSLDDFEEEDKEVVAKTWSHSAITQCGGHSILGGHCVDTNGAETQRTFVGLPAHTQLRVVAKYMFIDSWDGETGYLKVDSRPVWLESYNHKEGDAGHGINICGNDAPERKFGRTIDVTVPHTGDSVTLAFGATTDEHACDESFGIDSVMVFVR